MNAYTLTFAVLLLTGAALGDRYGRKRMFVIGMTIFTAASVLAALSSGIEMLIVARALQGMGAAIVTPLTLTILAAAAPREKRGAILGAWGGIAGLAVAIGPVVGGAIVDGISWQWIFWLNVPIGIVTIPLALRHLNETTGPNDKLDLVGLVLSGFGLFGLVFGVVRSETPGLGLGRGDRLDDRRPHPHLASSSGGRTARRSRCCRSASSAIARSRPRTPSPCAMYFGMFGSIFLLTQYLQIVLGIHAVRGRPPHARLDRA